MINTLLDAHIASYSYYLYSFIKAMWGKSLLLQLGA